MKKGRIVYWILGGGLVIGGGYLLYRWYKKRQTPTQTQAQRAAGIIPGVPGEILPPVSPEAGAGVEDLLSALGLGPTPAETGVAKAPSPAPSAPIRPTVRVVQFPETTPTTYAPQAPLAYVPKGQIPAPITGKAITPLPEVFQTPGGYTQLVPIAGGEMQLVAKRPKTTGGRYVVGEVWTEQSIKALQKGIEQAQPPTTGPVKQVTMVSPSPARAAKTAYASTAATSQSYLTIT